MFRKNNAHLQTVMLSRVNEVPEKQQRRLAQSWAGTFYRGLFSRIDESRFAVLYSDEPSRPNIAVNVRVALEYLKAGPRNTWFRISTECPICCETMLYVIAP